MYEIVTLKEVKTWLAIDLYDHGKDLSLKYMISWVSTFIEQYINKQVITREYIEYQDGGGKDNILTRFYPIYSIESIYDDPDRLWGAGELIASTDYVIYYDRGQVKVTGSETIFLNSQQNVRIDYRAGYSRYLLLDEQNNYLDVKESTSSTAYPVEVAPSALPFGMFVGYDAEGLASAVEASLNCDVNLALEYSVGYNQEDKTFTLSSGTSFDLQWKTGESIVKNMSGLLGFSVTTDVSGASHQSSSTDAYTGVPQDLKSAALMIIDFVMGEAAFGDGQLSEVKRWFPHGEGNLEYIKDIPKMARAVLDSYAGALA